MDPVYVWSVGVVLAVAACVEPIRLFCRNMRIAAQTGSDLILGIIEQLDDPADRALVAGWVHGRGKGARASQPNHTAKWILLIAGCVALSLCLVGLPYLLEKLVTQGPNVGYNVVVFPLVLTGVCCFSSIYFRQVVRAYTGCPYEEARHRWVTLLLPLVPNGGHVWVSAGAMDPALYHDDVLLGALGWVKREKGAKIRILTCNPFKELVENEQNKEKLGDWEETIRMLANHGLFEDLWIIDETPLVGFAVSERFVWMQGGHESWITRDADIKVESHIRISDRRLRDKLRSTFQKMAADANPAEHIPELHNLITGG